MRSLRLAVAMADAIPHPAAPPEAEAPPPKAEPLAVAGPLAVAEPVAGAAAAAEEPDAPPRGRRRRGWLSSLVRRPAEYVRAYLTASLEHQFALQAHRTTEVAGAVARLDAWTAHAEAQARDQAQRLDGLGSMGARLVDVSEQLGRISSGLESLSRRLALVEQQQGGMAERQSRLAERLGEQERVHASLAADQIALARRNADASDHAVERLDQVLGVLGPRLDELEIKIRPVMEIDAESVAVRTADGYVMLPRSEPLFVTAVANATSGGLEPGVRRVLRALLQPGDACADVGANVGLLTVAMASAVGPEGRVWAFEPETRVRIQLARTLHLNGLRQVTLSGAAAGAEPGRLTFHQSPIIGHSSLYALPEAERAEERAVEVEVTTLDTVVPPGVALAAVKIDVEGAELDVLRGMHRVIADSPDIAVVAEFGPSHLHRVGIAPDAWFAAFAAHGLEPRLIAEPDGGVAATSAAGLAGVESANLVFVRAGGAADRRLPR